MAKEEKKNGKSSKKQNPLENNLPFEIANIVIICFGILLIISIYFGGGGFLGLALSSFFKGLFGIGAYILPIVIISFCAYLFFSNTTEINIFKICVFVISFLLFISLFHLISREKSNSFSNYGVYLLNEYKTGHFLDGGLLGAIIGDMFFKFLGNFMSYTLITILFMASLFVLAGKSFLETVVSFFKSISIDKEAFYDIKDKISEYKEERVKQKQEENIKRKRYIENHPKRYVEQDEIEYKRQSSEQRFKKCNNYIYDGVDKYRKIQPATFFDMSSKEKRNIDKKIIFAMDEINKSKSYEKLSYKEKDIQNKVPDFLRNEKVKGFDIYHKEDINLEQELHRNKARNETIELKEEINIYEEYPKIATKNMVLDYEKNQNDKDIFKICSKEEYLNDVYKKKKTEPNLYSSYDIELKFAKHSDIDAILNEIDDEKLPKSIEDIEDLEDFYNFDNQNNEELEFLENIKDLEKEDIEEEHKEEETIKYIENEDIQEQNIEKQDIKEDLENKEKEQKELKQENLNQILTNYPKNEQFVHNNNKEKVLIDDKKYVQEKCKKDKDGFVLMQKQDTSYKPPIDKIREEKFQETEPIIIRAEEEKIVTKLEKEQDEKREYIFPKLEFLNKNLEQSEDFNDIELRENSNTLVRTLKSFNVNAQVINISKGPSVTRYELSIEDGIKVSKILGLSDNLALSLAATSIRIEAPIPGKSAVGIEVPNKKVKSVFLSEVICSEKFQKFESSVSFGLGKDITGNVIVTDIANMPHMLIAGATGSGKSVCINTLITSILYKSSPDEVRLMMIDPKVVELSVYNGIPHLLTPVVTEPEKAAGVLNWAVSEMMERYNLFAKTGTRNLDGYNRIREENGQDKIPKIVIIIDELADLMMVAAKEVEAAICRLAQLARAAGIHLIIATQRPSVDVITGLIKSNVPSRIAFAVSSGTDSRTILDSVGAEKLLGKGDMLFKARDMNKPLRIQGAFISDKEVEKIISFIKENSSPNYDNSIIEKIDSVSKDKNDGFSENSDELTEDVIAFLVRKGKASTSMIQRQFRIGYNRAARIIEELEERGIVSSENGSKQRDVLMDKYQYEEYQNRYDNY